MKRHLLFLFLIFFTGIIAQAQISGTLSIPSTPYPTIASAIAALNSQGVGPEGVTFNIDTGYVETFTAPSDGTLTTLTTEFSKPIIFRKNGTGPSPVVTAGVGVSASIDAVFTIVGTDYVTFDGINVRDRSTNTTSGTRMEYGYLLLRASATDGTQYCTIKNCKIYDFQKTYMIGSINYNSSNQSVTPTSLAGTNSYNKIYADTIVNTTVPTGNKVSQAVYFAAHSSASTSGLYDLGNEIGVDGGNVLLNSTYINLNYQKKFKVSNNLFTTIDGYPNSCTYHIQTSGCFDDKISNNTIRDFSMTLNVGTYRPILEGTTDSCEVVNNVIKNINLGNNTATAFTGIDLQTNAAYTKCTGNTITNITHGGDATTTGSFKGINAQSGNMISGSYLYISGNQITGNTIRSSGTAVENGFIRVSWYGWMTKIYDNTITNNTVNCNGMTAGIDARSITANLIEKRIYGNTVSDLSLTNGTGYGIRHSYGLRTYIYKNNITRIKMEGVANPVLHGITVEDANTATTTIFNNYISELKTTLSSGTRQVTGINLVAGQQANVYYNTVYLDASSTGMHFGTAGIFANTTSTLMLRNNSIVNASQRSGNGKSVALYYGGTSLGNFDPGSNNNNYYIGTADTNHVIFYNGTKYDQTLLAYQARVFPGENASVSEMPPFTNASTSPYDLHIGGPTQCESAGIPISSPELITDDFYSTPRYPYEGYPIEEGYPPTRPDIGAEEFAGIWKDFSPPAVSLVSLANTALLTARTLTATITDLSGVATSGSGLPVLYWNINNGTWNAVTGVYETGNKYTFTFGAGVALNDSIKYFIVSQDLVTSPPNVGSSPAGAIGCTYDPPACGTPPPTPYAYKIIPGLCGTYNVGTGGDYPTLTAAINDLNSKAISCPVTYLLTDATYPAETFPISINAIQGSSETNTVTIRPAEGVSPVIAGSNPVSLITLNGARYVTIDGSNSGGSDRSLLFNNTNSTANVNVIYFSSPGGFGNSSSYCTLKNCRIKGSPQLATSTYGVRTNSSTGGAYDKIIIDNNEIYSARLGVRIQGTLAYPATNCQVINNMIGSPIDSISIQLYGIYNLYADNTLIQGNEVMGPSIMGNNQPVQTGIFAYTLATNTKVKNNKVHGWFNNSSLYGVIGIMYRAEAYTTTEISNNVIYDLKGPGSATVYQDIAGISVLNGGNVKIWHNSINLSGDVLTSASVTKSGCILLSNAVSNIDIRDNLLVNSLRLSSGSVASKTFGIYNAGPLSQITTLDNNDYYINGVGPYIGELSGSVDYATLSVWQGATAMDQNSRTDDPLFTSPTNLLPTTTAMPHAGTYISSVPVDYNGVTRANPPDIGAIEFTTNPAINTVSATPQSYSATLNGTAYAANYIVDLFFDYGLTTTYGNTVAATPANVTGITTTPMSADISGLTVSTTYHYRARGVTAQGIIIYGTDKTFTTLSTAPIVVTTDATSVSWEGATLNGTVNANGSLSTVTFEYGPTTAYGTVVSGTPNSVSGSVVTVISADLTGLEPGKLYHYRIVAINAGGTSYGNDMTFSLNKLVNIKVYLEGLYNTGTGAMNQAQGDAGAQYGPGIADVVTVELHGETAPYDLMQSFDGVELSTTGDISIRTIPGVFAGSFYIVIKHRNSLETWSAAAVPFTNVGTVSYDFSTAAAQAYGDNQRSFGSLFALWAGDLNQDGVVDGADMSAVFNTSQPPALTGYHPEDINGDGIVDGADMSLIFNNSQPPPVQVIKP